jgi:hypothetical protein
MTKKTTAQRRRRLHSNRKHSRTKFQIVKITGFIEFFDINVASETQSVKFSKTLISNATADLCRARRSVKFRKTCEFQEGAAMAECCCGTTTSRLLAVLSEKIGGAVWALAGRLMRSTAQRS